MIAPLLALALMAQPPAPLAATLEAALPARIVMAHYMPWFQGKPAHSQWGWHWTMNHFNPDHVVNGVQPVASHYHPLIGAYDSADADAIECQVQLMRASGIQGVFLDWYGIEHFADYADVHKNCQVMIQCIQRAKMKFAVVYEDHTVKNLVDAHVFPATDAIARGQIMMQWLDKEWFSSSSYLKQNGNPVFLVFGPQYYNPNDYDQLFQPLRTRPEYYSLAFRKGSADGSFNWPVPQRGETESWYEFDRFTRDSAEMTTSISVAYPRFHDIYKEANVQESYGTISDHDGATFRKTLRLAIQSPSPIVQIATWNDWGEGTQIEPSTEFGYRDLEVLQRAMLPLHPDGKRFTPDDLRLPVKLYQLRKKVAPSTAFDASFKLASTYLLRGDPNRAKTIIDRIAARVGQSR